jgi:hypothetical protein
MIRFSGARDRQDGIAVVVDERERENEERVARST